jgi:hypothetical protein
MRELEFLEDEDEISQDVFDALFRCPHPEPICPRLVKLTWVADSVFGGDFVHFFSPQLREVRLSSRPGTVFSFAQSISTLPILSLKTLSLSVAGDHTVRGAILSLLKTCPKNLRTLEVTRMNQLCDGSWCRILILLYRLRTLETDQFPPTWTLPATAYFPSLQQATFRGPVAPRWIQFLSESSGQKVPSATGIRPRIVAPHLRKLYLEYEFELDSTFTFPLRMFRNLSALQLKSACSHDVCAFRLTDEDVSQLATQLPELRQLSLGTPCPHNDCMTTVDSLLSLSTHCKELRELRLHFNTRNFARDMKNSIHNALRHTPRPPSRCPLTILDVWQTPLTPDALGADLFPTLIGLVDIFPRLQRIMHRSRSPLDAWGWQRLDAQIASLQEMRTSLPSMFA